MTFSSIEQRNPYLRAGSLPELLSWHDVDFVRCAYVTVLGRQPDPEGEFYYLDRFRLGHSKLEIISQLRLSPEGPAHDPGIAGLDRALKRARWERHPIVGWAVRSFTGGEGNSSGWKRHRALLHQLALIHDQHVRQTNSISSINALLADLKEISVSNVAPTADDQSVGPPTSVTMAPAELDPELDSRSRYALQLLQIEAKSY